MASFVLSFSPLDVLDGIWDLIESVSGGFLTYSFVSNQLAQSLKLIISRSVQFYGTPNLNKSYQRHVDDVE